MNGQPKPGFYIVVALVVLALVIFAVVRSDIFAPKANQPKDEPIDPNVPKKKAEAPATGGNLPQNTPDVRTTRGFPRGAAKVRARLRVLPPP